MGSTKSVLTNIGEALGAKASEFTFLNAPLIEAPFTTITNLDGSPRKLKDPNSLLKGNLGIDRTDTIALYLMNERGPNGQQVWGLRDDDRIRFVGNWTAQASLAGSSVSAPATETSNFIEITFFGTGLNLLNSNHTGALDWRYSVDGGAESGNFLPSSSNTVLSNRNYAPHIVVPVVANLALGVHTVRVRKNDTISGFACQGFEVIGNIPSISVSEGEIIAFGRKYTNSSNQTTPYNSGFDGNPVLNGRGGKVVEYITAEGRIGKVIQQTDSSVGFLGTTNHSNEEIIKKINWREFGAQRADDWSTLTTSSARAYTLNDGTTTLIGTSVLANTSFTGKDSMAWDAPGGFVAITFVGTGLDILMQTRGTLTFTGQIAVSVDGGAETNHTPAIDRDVVEKIVSGLPFGTHTVRVRLNTAQNFTISDFYIYGPKTPEIPANAVAFQEYYLMSDFVANTTAGMDTISRGVIRKAATKELQLVGANWVVSGITPVALGGFGVATAVSTQYSEYTFYGTGFDWRFSSANARTTSIQMQLQNLSSGGSLQNLTTTNFPTIASSVYGLGVAFNSGTGIADQQDATGSAGAGLVISGLPLGLYKVRMTNNQNANMDFNAFDVITPVYGVKDWVGSCSLGSSLKSKTSNVEEIDLSKAKVLARFDGVTSLMKFSKNILGVVKIQTAVYEVYFSKPFKNPGQYVAIATANDEPNVQGFMCQVRDTRPGSCRIILHSSSGAVAGNDAHVMLAIFGELQDEE